MRFADHILDTHAKMTSRISFCGNRLFSMCFVWFRGKTVLKLFMSVLSWGNNQQNSNNPCCPYSRARCSTSWLDGPPRGQAAAFDSSSPGWSFCRIRGCNAPATISLCGFSFLRHYQRVTWRGGQDFTAQGFEITVLATALVYVWPHLFDPPNVRHFHSLLFLGKPVVDAMFTGWFTNQAFLLPVAVWRVDLPNCAIAEPFLGVSEVDFCLERSLIILPYMIPPFG